MSPAEKKRILLADPDHRVIARLSERLWEASFIVDSASTDRGALLRLREPSPDVLIASVTGIDGEGLCRQARGAGNAVIILVYPPGCREPARLADAAGADGYLIAPLDPGSVVNSARWAIRLREATAQLEALKKRSDERVLAPIPGTSEASKLELELYKRFLLMELKRSHRNHFPLAFLVVGIDRFQSTVGRLRPHERSHVSAQILGQINDTIREIDLAAAESHERFHVCLPQTDFDGARLVAERLRSGFCSFREWPARLASPSRSGTCPSKGLARRRHSPRCSPRRTRGSNMGKRSAATASSAARCRGRGGAQRRCAETLPPRRSRRARPIC